LGKFATIWPLLVAVFSADVAAFRELVEETMASYTWLASGSGDFPTASNWTLDGINPSPTAPGALDICYFTMPITATISGNANVTRIFVNNPASNLTFTGQSQFAAIDIDGTVNLATGGSFTASLGLGVAPDAGSTGTFVVGPGATYVGTLPAETSNPLFNIGNGAGATGSVIVQGPGALVDTGDNPGTIATSPTSTGSLQVSGGGVVKFGSLNPAVILSLTVGRGGTGTVTVDGPGSQLQLSGAMYAGRAGIGTVTLTNGASLTETAVGTGLASNFGNGGGNPFVTGGTGTLNVLSGSTATFGDSLGFGVNGATGVGLVSDATLNVGGLLRVGSGTTVPGGKGTLTVTDGGIVRDTAAADTSTAHILLGATAGTTGTVAVEGHGSKLDAGANAIDVGAVGSGTLTGTDHGLIMSSGLTVGGGGTGTLDLTSGAKAIATAAPGGGAALSVGAHTGSTGSVSVSGFGSALIAWGEAVLGGTDTGTGVSAGGIGDVSISQDGFLATGNMTIESGSSLAIDDAAALITGNLSDGGSVTSDGLLRVSGSMTGEGSFALDGGLADLGSLDSTNVSFGGSAMLRVHALNGASTVSGMQQGDIVDLAGLKGVSLTGDTVTAGSGMLFLDPAPAGDAYRLITNSHGAMVLVVSDHAHGAGGIAAWDATASSSTDDLPDIGADLTRNLGLLPAAPTIASTTWDDAIGHAGADYTFAGGNLLVMHPSAS
jgi:autotransporter family porin